MRTQTRYGEMDIFANDLISNALLTYGEWAQNELDFLLQFIEPGDVVIDGGANIGYFSLGFANRLKGGNDSCLISLEPVINSYNKLFDNTKNIPVKALLLNNALSHKEGKFFAVENQRNRGATRLQQLGGESEVVVIDSISIDFLTSLPVSFIKLDLEGMEYQALLGANRTLYQFNPTVFCEVNTAEAAKEVPGYMRSLGYHVLGLRSKAFNPNNSKGATHNMFGDAHECGFIMIHDSKMNKFGHLVKNLLTINSDNDIVDLLGKR